MKTFLGIIGAFVWLLVLGATFNLLTGGTRHIITVFEAVGACLFLLWLWDPKAKTKG